MDNKANILLKELNLISPKITEEWDENSYVNARSIYPHLIFYLSSISKKKLILIDD